MSDKAIAKLTAKRSKALNGQPTETHNASARNHYENRCERRDLNPLVNRKVIV